MEMTFNQDQRNEIKDIAYRETTAAVQEISKTIKADIEVLLRAHFDPLNMNLNGVRGKIHDLSNKVQYLAGAIGIKFDGISSAEGQPEGVKKKSCQK